MTDETFYDLNTVADEEQHDVASSPINMPPFQHRMLENEKYKDELTWLKEYFHAYVAISSNRFSVYKYHNRLFRGDHFDQVQDSWENNLNLPFNPRHAINYIYDAVDARAALRSKRKSHLNFIPNDEQDIEQYNNAKACSLVYRNRSDELKLDKLHTQADFHSDIFGDCFMFVLWDKMINDVVVKVIPPTRVFPEIRYDEYSINKCNHIEYVEWVNEWELKAMYPDYEAKKGAYGKDTDFSEDKYRSGAQILVHHFYHRHTKYLKKGRYIKYTDECILEEGDLPYEHGYLPVVHSGDIELPEAFWHMSFIAQVEQIQRANNDVYSSMVRDHGYAGPKWFVPKGAKVKEASLGPGHNIVEYSGMQAPVMMSYNPTNHQNYEFLEYTKKELLDLSKVFDMSRGKVPPGITANSALRFLDEQETRRSDLLFSRKAERVEEVGNQIIAIMAQEYKQDHMQMVRMLGENNEYLIRDFRGNAPDFKKIYRVRTENMSALPSSMTGRIATIIDMNMSSQKDPIFGKEEIMHILNMESDERFKNAATAAVQSAMEMMNDLLDGRETPDILQTDNTLVYYRVFDRFMQSMRYKRSVPPPIQEEFVERLKTIEGLIYEQCKSHPRMLDEVLQMEYFPRTFTPNIPLSQLVLSQQPMPPAPPTVDPSKAAGLVKRTKDPVGGKDA